jgi:anaerobic magnesium-protoporphyrin IX monomethyl ester cyclase
VLLPQGPLPGTPLFSRVASLTTWDDWEVSNQVKFVYPSEFDERWLGRRINETMEDFRQKKGGIGSGKKPDR